MQQPAVKMADSTQQIEKRVATAQRLLALGNAKDHMADFMHVMMPDEEFPDDIKKTSYQRAPHALLLCTLVEEMEAGTRNRTAVSIAPQHGKTIHLSTMGPAWILGRNPKARIIVASYNEIRAGELGDAFRAVLESPVYKTIFPGVELATGSKSKTSMKTTVGGRIFFVGLGGTVTGRTADYFIIDDPMKDDTELQNPNFRDNMWKWFFSVAFSRGSNNTRMLVVHTRWHVDDLIGRLCDPSHPERAKSLKHISGWTYLNIPGVIFDKEVADLMGLQLSVPTDPRVLQAFGSKPSVALWAADKNLAHFAQWKLGEPRTFSALVMGHPTIEDGEFFGAGGLLEYDIKELPPNLKVYGSSDHAVSEAQYRDSNCIGCVGVDEEDTIWVFGDIRWEQMETDKVVDELLFQFKTHKPLLWGMESELISKSFGPFLHKRMVEDRIYTPILPISTAKDKRTKARAIQGRIQMGKVRFPAFAPWWQDAKSQMLQFPYGPHDDFVDFLSNIGQMLMLERGASLVPANSNEPSKNSLAGILKNTLKNAGKPVREKASATGW
jgi:predicted phage terminase large subunit-like protein